MDSATLEVDAPMLFPIDDAENYLRSFANDLQRDNNVMRWNAGGGVSILSVEPMEYQTFDGLLVREQVSLVHTNPIFADIPMEDAARYNQLSTLSALIPGIISSPAMFVSKVGIFETDREAAERVYAPLLCSEAGILAFHANCLAQGQFRINPEISPITQHAQRPPYSKADYAQLVELGERKGLIASADDSHFTVEYPWEPGARSRMFNDQLNEAMPAGADAETVAQLDRVAGKTSLLQVFESEHPLYGKGIQSLVELPIPIDDEGAVKLVDELNRWEFSGVDLAPQFGAWHIGNRAPAFGTFIPTQFCLPGLLQNLFYWGLSRQYRCRMWMESSVLSS